MQRSKAKILTVALAVLMVVGTLDSASARKKKRVRADVPATTSEKWLRHVPGQLVPVALSVRASGRQLAL